MPTAVHLNDPEMVDANRRGQIAAAQRKAARVAGTTVVFAILLVVPGFMGGALAIVGMGLLAEGEWAGLLAIGAGAAIAGPLGAYAVFKLFGVLRVQQDLNEGRIEQAEGEVRWTGHRYTAEWTGRPRWVGNTASGLAPGTYRFYFLPRSGRLLSAAALPGLTLSTGEGLAEVLQKVHRFDDEDLRLNRHGQLSPRQKQRLSVSAAGYGLLGVVISGTGAVGALGLTTDGGDADAWVAMGIIVLVTFLFGVVMVHLCVQLLRDAAKGSVKQVTGMTRRSLRSNGTSASYHYHVKDEQFTVSAKAYNALAPDREYRVYYTPRSRRIVAVELTDSNRATRGTL